MTRARIPSPAALADALNRMGVFIPNQTGVYAERRLYDRSSGNFKAMGWLCEITTRSVDKGYVTFYLGIPDDMIVEREQTTLTPFE